jgi:hypothetical protein
MSPYIDASVYPDCEPPNELNTPELRDDYLQRVIGAFDQGIPPDERTLHLLAGWQDVFDRVRLLHSPGYHALRSYFAWPPLPREKSFVEPTYRILDALEGREDGFENQV